MEPAALPAFEDDVRRPRLWLAALYAVAVPLFAIGIWWGMPHWFGWSAVAAGGVDLRELPGDHWAIVRPPAIEAVAAALQMKWCG